MTVSWFYLITLLAILIAELRGEVATKILSTETLLLWILIVLANGIISICSRLDDLKRK